MRFSIQKITRRKHDVYGDGQTRSENESVTNGNFFVNASPHLPMNAGPFDSGSCSTSPRAAQFMADRDGDLPVWVRAPKRGHEFYSGCSRAKLYEWAAKSLI